jgi:hypothetical protein
MENRSPYLELMTGPHEAVQRPRLSPAGFNALGDDRVYTVLLKPTCAELERRCHSAPVKDSAEPVGGVHSSFGTARSRIAHQRACRAARADHTQGSAIR